MKTITTNATNYTIPCESYYATSTTTNSNYTFQPSITFNPETITATAVGHIDTFVTKEDWEKVFGKNIYFKKVIERNPNRVYEFIFQDGTHVKTICAEEDLKIFNLKYAFFLALAKYLYKDKYTFIGILNKVPDLMNQKKYIKIVEEGMKLFKKEQEQKEKEETEKKKIKAIKKNHHLKNQRKKEKKRAKELEELKQTIKDAINESK